MAKHLVEYDDDDDDDDDGSDVRLISVYLLLPLITL